MLKIFCCELKVSQHGSKKDLLKRLSRKVRENEAIETFASAQERYESHIEPLALPENERPSDEEVAMVCVLRVKIKIKPCKTSVELGEEQSPRPTIAVDYCFTATGLSEEPTAIRLVAMNSWSRMIQATPVASKGRALTD